MRVCSLGYASGSIPARSISLCACVSFLSLLWCLPAWGAPQPDTKIKTILIVTPTEITSPSAQIIDRAMYEAFDDSPERVTILYEHLTQHTEPPTQHETDTLALLKKKYQGINIDLVVARGKAGLDFLERNGEQIWPGIPAMFFCISDASNYWRERPRNKSGVFIAYDYSGALTLIQQLQPSVRRIIQIVAPYDREDIRVMQAELSTAAKAMKSGLTIDTMPKVPVPELLKQVTALNGDTALLATAFDGISDGIVNEAGDILKNISAAANVPLYGMRVSYIGNGAVAGQVPDLAEHGRQAAQLALNLLANPTMAPTVEITRRSRCIVDDRQLRRWQFNLSAIPGQCERPYHSLTFWDHYGLQITVLAFLLTAISILLATLHGQRRQVEIADEETSRQRTALAHVARLGNVSELTASIVHEINQPLGSIMANTDAATMMLKHHVAPDGELMAILVDIRNENFRASQIIQKLRTLLTKNPLELIPLSLNDIVDSSRSLLGNLAIRHHATLQVYLGADLPLIMGDSTHLQQILINLTSNAMEAMSQFPPAQRILTLTTGTDSAGDVLLIVSDNGPGIAKDILPNIFESFYTTKQDGMGMGLAIVQTIVHALAGKIEVSNNPQGGATFKITMPAFVISTLQARSAG